MVSCNEKHKSSLLIPAAVGLLLVVVAIMDGVVPVGEGHPNDGQNEGEEDGSSEDLEWTTVTRFGSTNTKRDAVKKAGIVRSTQGTHRSAYNGSKQSGEYSEKYGKHKECSYFENNPIVVPA